MTGNAAGCFIASEMLPLLRWDVSLTPDDAPTLQRGDWVYRFDGIDRVTLAAVVRAANGRTAAGDIASRIDAPAGMVRAILAALTEADVVKDARKATGDIAPARFVSVCRNLFPEWKTRLFTHPLWCQLAEGTATQSQFMGWLLESYHFISGVNARLALAVAECPDVRVRAIYAQHYAEEYDHDDFFMASLVELGVDSHSVLESRPLPGTTAVIHHMRKAARVDPLAYAVCSGFLESTGSDRRTAREFFDRLTRNYSSAAPEAIQPMIDHVNLDEQYGHEGLIEEICAVIGVVSVERASTALGFGYQLLETLELWSTDISRTYGGQSSAPRTDRYPYRPAAWKVRE
ncbi:MAG: hypothetical protein M3O70_02270 [Actinomycetota bacterium]|nr:hypothetical protein [Actinomycetota bacterium]